MKSNQSTKIKMRQKPNDVFITPLKLAKKHIQIVKNLYKKKNKIWYDPFKNSGRYYNNFNEKNKKWSEILDGRDFFDFNEQIANGAISRFSYGLEFYPLNLLEIKFQIREYNFVDPVNYITDYNDGGNKSEYLLQIHAWF